MKTHTSNQSSPKGSTLIEALLSILIVAIGSLGLINLQGHMQNSQSNTNQYKEAMRIAEAKIEELKNFSTPLGYDALSNGSDTYAGVNSTYTRSWTITKKVDPNYATVNLSVTWQRRDSLTATVTLASEIGRLNPILSGRAMDSLVPPPPLDPNNAAP